MTSPSQPPDAYKKPPPASINRLPIRTSIVGRQNITDHCPRPNVKEEVRRRFQICVATSFHRLLSLAVILLLVTAPPSAAPANYTAFDTGLYLAVVYPLEDAGLQRAANRSLASLQLQIPFPITPLYTPFPSTANFPGVLETLCRKWEGRTVVGALVLSGNSGLVLATALATGGVAVPMLWLSQSSFVQEPIGNHVVRVGPSEKGLVVALRSLLLTSKWHSFHLLYGGPLSGLDHDKLKWLRKPPLNPIVHRLNPASVNMRVMKSLSHSSRGIVVVMGDIVAASAILDKATSLGLTGSGIVWIWADTGEVVSAPASPEVAAGPPPSLVRTRRSRSARYETPMRLPVGLLALKAAMPPMDRHLVRAGVRLLVDAMRRAAIKVTTRLSVSTITRSMWKSATSCSVDRAYPMANFTEQLVKELRRGVLMSQTGRVPINDTSGMRTLAARYQILNLVPELTESFTQEEQQALPRNGIQLSNNWKQVGDILGCCDVRLERIIWPGGNIGGPCGGPRGKIKVVTAVAAPFVMTSDIAREADRDSCLRGVPCQMVSDYNGTRYTYKVSCCYGLSMDLLEAVAQELDLDFSLYMVPDTMFGSRIIEPDTGAVRWTGVVGDLISGHADMAFTALSVSRPRSEVIDFSGPYYFSGVSFLAAPNQQTDIPLLAFLLPFSTELWIAIFTSLNVTAVAVAIYEWLSPFGLNPWGRQRTKNFSMSSALWVCWGLLCGHLVAFKAPKSWPNKFLINVWGGFSVIFVASYTANIAALIAGLFFHSATATYHDNSLLWQRVGTPKGSASEYYVHRANQMLWEHMQRFFVPDIATGVQYLKNGTLDILIADTPILDYYRATDPGCKLQKIGDTINEDTYAIGMTKGFPLKDSVSSVIAKFTSNGYMDILQEKWYGGLACFSLDMDMSQPKPLGVTAVAGVFMLLGLGFVVGLVILVVEHLFYRYTLPILRHKPKGTIWRSRNIMFFSQKLYRFINCVELVSPHHAARELVHTIRQGQITSLFQKSVKRKEHEQRRRRKSKAQFFEMIQEIRRVQQEEKVNSLSLSDIEGASSGSPKHGSQAMSRNAQQIYGTADRAKRIPSSPSTFVRSGIFRATWGSLVHSLWSRMTGCRPQAVDPMASRRPEDARTDESARPASMESENETPGFSPLTTHGHQKMRRQGKELIFWPKYSGTKLELARRFSKDVFRSKSSSNLEARKFSSDINFAASRFFEAHSSQAIGRRLSRDTNLSPPDINSRRASHLVLTPELSVASSDGIEVAPKSPYLSLPHQKTLPSNYNHHSSFSSGSSPLGKQLSLQEHTLAAATSRSTDDRLSVNHHHLPVSKQSSLGERSSSGSDSHHRPPPHSRQLPPHLPPHHPGSMTVQHHVPKQSSLQERSSAGMSHSMPKQTSLQEPPPEINVHPPPTPRRVTSLSGAPLGLPPPHPPKRPTDNQKFSYVDTTSPSFRERISKYAEDANNTISMSAEERRRHAPSLLEQISSMQEQFPTKPKVVSVKPKVPPRDGIPALRQVQSADGDPNLASGRSSSTVKRSIKDKSS